MKLSLTTNALLMLLGLTATSSVSAAEPRIRGAVRGHRVLQNDKNNDKNNNMDVVEDVEDVVVEDVVEENDKNNDKDVVEDVVEENNDKNNNDKDVVEVEEDPAVVLENGVMEMRVCETVTSVERSIAFISSLGDKAKGSAECLADPVNGCAGGCCRVASAFFVCDATGSDAPILPCVCNSLTVDPLLAELGDQIALEEGAGGDLGDLVETAIAAASFNTLVDLVTTAGLVETLQSEGPFTLFAPLDSAFPSGEALEAFKNVTDLETLASILNFHVVPGEILAADLSEGVTVTTVEGTNLTISVMGGPMVNNANIVATDIRTSNGIIHVLDTMLDPFAPKDIVETAIAAGNFTTLVDLIAAAGLVDTLQGPGPFTVFAPLDSAFPTGAALDEFKANMDLQTLASVLTYHVVPGKIMSTDLSEGLTVSTVQGSNVTFSLMGGAMVNDANIVEADVETINGVIHFIDTLLLPVTLPADPVDPTTDTAGTVPVPAPVDTGDDTGMVPLPAPVDTGMVPAPAPLPDGSAPIMDLVQTAVSAGSFTVLSDLLMLSGLIPTLQQEGPFTVFAPNDFAFGSEEEVAALRDLPAATIAEILKYHVVPGKVSGFDLMTGKVLTTVQGSDLTVALGEDGGLSINDAASILQHDKVASNGIIHMINQVLTPPMV